MYIATHQEDERSLLLNEFVQRLGRLTYEQIATLLQVALMMQPAIPENSQIVDSAITENYDEKQDPLIGFLTGPSDFASQAKQILSQEIYTQNGWTQKALIP